MKKHKHGPSLYFASDKNVFDALNQHKVDIPTIMKLFQHRNIIVARKTPREDLANYFATLPHDYYDHREISARLGIAQRRERVTSMDVVGINEPEALQIVIQQLKEELQVFGEIVQVKRDGDNLAINVQYSTVDYKKSEFTQVQICDGSIEFVKSTDGYVIRNTQNDYINDIRDSLLTKIENVSNTPLTKTVVSLFDIPSPKLRSKFFHSLMTDLPGYSKYDVTDVYVYKAKPESFDENDSDTSGETHVERVSLRGNEVQRSELLNGLLDKEDYYITKVRWSAKETMGDGNVLDIEAVFSNPNDCTGFSFILKSIFPVEEGKVSAHKRTPNKREIDTISRIIEIKSRELIIELRQEYAAQNGS